MQSAPLLADRGLPHVVSPPASAEIGAWAAEHAAAIQALAERAGVVLIRGTGIVDPAAFRAFCAAVEPDLRDYTGGDSPRTGVAEKVYTSTEYDAGLEIFLHNELSYAGWSPRLVFFGCLQPSEEGGETQIADGREVYAALPADLRARFEEKGIVYLQHLWDADGPPGIGKSWQQTFETEDRGAVEAYLAESGMDFEWTDFGIRTRAPHAAIRRHPKTGEKVWWNQADQWHRGLAGVKTSFGAADDPRFDPATAGEETLGNHVTYGDGSEIAAEDLLTARETARSREVAFPWQAGDVMVIDNVLAMHGRKPYRGARRVLVAMA
jgi:alpha-ketoglutarate-dependent taurine dioxygenase